MEKFPTNFELLEFFGVKPDLSNSDDTPWAYSRLSFSVELDKERVDCVIDNPELEVRWFREEVEIAYLSLGHVQDLSVQEYPVRQLPGPPSPLHLANFARYLMRVTHGLRSLLQFETQNNLSCVI